MHFENCLVTEVCDEFQSCDEFQIFCVSLDTLLNHINGKSQIILMLTTQDGGKMILVTQQVNQG